MIGMSRPKIPPLEEEVDLRATKASKDGGVQNPQQFMNDVWKPCKGRNCIAQSVRATLKTEEF